MTICCQLAVLLFFAFPPVALGLSSLELAQYFNRHRALPSRLILAQERVGSVVFYLDRDLRSQLTIGQIANHDIDDPLPSPLASGDEWIAIPERHLHTALNDYDLEPISYEGAGRFRLYRRSDVEPRALVGRLVTPLLR